MDSQEIDSTPVMPSQPTNSRRRPRDEEPPAPRRRRRIPSSRSLAIVFEVEPAFNGLPEGVFAGQFHNEDTEVHAWSEVEGVGHYRWLQWADEPFASPTTIGVYSGRHAADLHLLALVLTDNSIASRRPRS